MAISAIRIQYLPAFSRATDDTYTNVDASGWSLGELCLGIVCACLPTLGPLLFKLENRLRPALKETSKCPDFSSGFTTSGALETGVQWRPLEWQKLSSPWPREDNECDKAGTVITTSCTSVGHHPWRNPLHAIVERPDQARHDEIELLESPRKGTSWSMGPQDELAWETLTDSIKVSDAMRQLERPPGVKVRGQ